MKLIRLVEMTPNYRIPVGVKTGCPNVNCSYYGSFEECFTDDKVYCVEFNKWYSRHMDSITHIFK